MIFIKPKEEEEEEDGKHKSLKPVVVTTRLCMKKHASIPDVYYIKPKGQKETLAYIPNIVTSQRCESWFTAGNNTVQAEFEYLDAIDKWVPVAMA